jgi:hypothetical protein
MNYLYDGNLTIAYSDIDFEKLLHCFAKNEKLIIKLGVATLHPKDKLFIKKEGRKIATNNSQNVGIELVGLHLTNLTNKSFMIEIRNDDFTFHGYAQIGKKNVFLSRFRKLIQDKDYFYF